MRSSHYRQKATILFAGLTVFGLTALISLLALRPTGSIISRADTNSYRLHPVVSFIHTCHIAYTDCQKKPHRPTVLPAAAVSLEAADIIGKTYDLNPQLLITLASLTSHDSNREVNQTELTLMAQKLVDMYKQIHNQPIPLIFDHPQLGTYQLNGLNEASYLTLRYLATETTNPQEFQSYVAAPNSHDGQVVGFQEMFTSLFNQDPLSP